MPRSFHITQLLEHMTEALAVALDEQEDEILNAIQRIKEEQGEEDKPLKFSCSLGGILNLYKSMVETNFSFSVKTSVKSKFPLDDPSQVKLKFTKEQFEELRG